MKYFTLTIIATFALSISNVYGQPADQDKKPALIFVENGNGDAFNGQTYISSLRGAGRNGNGNSNGAFGNIADWSVDMVVSEKSPEQAANDFGGFRDNQHPLYQGSDALTQNSTGLGALGWASLVLTHTIELQV